MKTNSIPTKAALGIIGIGNTIAGDDGAGIIVVRHLQKILCSREDIFFYELTGDLLEMAELLHRAERFIFIDALAGDNPGEIKTLHDKANRSFTSSFHQTDISSVMHALNALSLISPFPPWEVWGIVIDPPTEFRKELSPPVSLAIDKLIIQFIKMVKNWSLYSGEEQTLLYQD
jgi:hydrogenase maturation protease